VNSPVLARLAGPAIAALLALSPALTAEASAFYGGTNTWTVVGPPNEPAVGIDPGLNTTYHNNLTIPTEGFVAMVLRNAMGQTVLISIATLSLQATSNGTAFLVARGLPNEDYNASVFAFTPAGVAISTSSETVLVVGPE
jgi:hypothetical protein